MNIDQAAVHKIAHLARLELSQQEEVEMADTLGKVLSWMEHLNELDTTQVAPLVHLSEEINALREDVAIGTLSHEEGLKNAPKRDKDYFRVPKVIE